MSTTRIGLDLTDEERAALGALCDRHYRSIAAIVQFLACTAASYTCVSRGRVEEAHLLAQAAHRAKEM